MAAVISYEEYEALISSKADTSGSELKSAIEGSQKQHKIGDVGTEEGIFKILRDKDTD